MKSLEEFILCEVLGVSRLSKCKDLELDSNEVGELFLTYNDGKSTRKVDISRRLWCSLQHLYDTYVSTEMLRCGYHLIPMEGGHIVFGGEEPYQVMDQSCTCPHYLYGLKKKARCQHLIFRDWHLAYRVKCNEIRMSI